MDNFNFNGYYYNKCIYWFLLIAGAIILVIFLSLNISREDRYILSIVPIVIGWLIVFYLNKSEPKFIKVDKEKIEIAYLNKYFFERENGNYSKDEIKISRKNDRVVLSNNAGLIANIRRKALDAEDWETLNKYFE